MFELKIIILIIIIKILSFIISQYYTDKHVNKILTHSEKKPSQEQEICITPSIKDFMLCWIKFTIEIIDYSKAILSKDTKHTQYYSELETTKDELINIFSKIHKEYTGKFESLINEQISLKIDLCNAILYNDMTNISLYSQELTNNTNKLSDFFNQLKQNEKVDTENIVRLKDTMSLHTDKYIKSIKFINKAGNEEIGRELIFGAFDSAKLMFV